MPILLSVQPLGGPLVAAPCTGAPLANGELATVQAAVNAAVNGDVLCIPAGAWTWSGALTIGTQASPKYLTLRGAGSGLTGTVITQNAANLLYWYTHYGGLSRLTGFRILGTTTANYGVATTLLLDDNLTFPTGPHFRIDNNYFGWYVPASMWGISSALMGVFDHNAFYHTGNANSTAIFVGFAHGNSENPNFGDTQWNSPSPWGTPNQVVFEDNTFTHDNAFGGTISAGASSALGGSRKTVRFNTGDNTYVSVNHGTESGGRWRGSRSEEIYHNTYNWNAISNVTGSNIGTRGGTTRFFNNTYVATKGPSTTALLLETFRYQNPGIGAGTPFGTCGKIPVASIIREGTTAVVTMTGESIALWHHVRPRNGFSIRIEGANQSEYNGTFNVLEMAMTALTHTGAVAHATTAVKHRMQTGDHIWSVTGANLGAYNVIDTTPATTLITRIDDMHFDYTMASDPGADATITVFATPYFMPKKYVTYTVAGSPATPATLAITGTPIKLMSPWDGNTNDDGYPCLDMIGRGQGTILLHQLTPAADHPTYPAVWPNQALEPLYVFGNQSNGVIINQQVAGTLSEDPNHLWNYIHVECREYFQQRPLTPFTGACTPGSAGVGVGPRSQRPGPPRDSAPLTPGIGWWATDAGSWRTALPPNTSGCLDIAISATQWQDCAYTPYQYPHPLTLIP